MSQSQPDRIAWRGALIAAVLGAVGSPIDLLISSGLPDFPRWPPVAAAIACATIAIVLLVRWRHPNRKLAATLFLLNTGVVTAFLWVMNAHFATLGRGWAPYQANKLGALTVAFLTPELLVGLVSIAAYGGSAVLQWILFSLPVRSHLAVGEPWATLAYCGFAVVLLFQFHRRYVLERQIAHAQANALALEHLARNFLVVRDFTNTPLQTIVSTAELVALRHPDMSGELKPIEDAIRRLRELNQFLSRHDASIRWDKSTESIDADTLLRSPSD
jgi:hypothetical protein